MLNSEIKEIAPTFPPGFRREYDAHIYYDAGTRDAAIALRNRVFQELSALPIYVSPLVDKKVGPHPTPMFEICFATSLYDEVRNWLDRNRGSLTVLVHAVTGDDPRDHSIGAEWLGDPVELDFTKLDPSPDLPHLIV